MAIRLSSDLSKTLNTSGRITDEGVNPDHLSRLDFSQPLSLIYQPHHAYTEDEADLAVDQLTEYTEAMVQENRVIDAQTDAAKVYNQKLAKLDKLRSEIAKGMKTIEKGYAEWQALIHEVEVAKRKAGVDLGARAEKANIAFEAHQRSLKQQLHNQTNLARSGTHAGSSILNRRPIPISA